MAVSTVDEYLSALEKSKLLGSEQLVEAQRLAGESSDAAALARALARENLVSRWQASTLLALGQRAQLRLGKYKLIQRLGKGGMGTVFLAEHVTMNRRVALKVVPRSIAENRASLDRFFAEARAIAALDHPNIVQAYSVDNEMDRYFIVMEFVDGQDLQHLVDLNGPLDFERAENYIRQSAEGLAHAHARNLVHCDIKPSNLLVNQQDVIKILDLGLARLNQSDEPRGTAAGEPAFGTVDYMAPEQALEAENFDHRADVYSLGCTLYCLLTGHPPFPEGSLAQRIVKHQTQEPRDILLERPNTPPKLVEICKRMMAKEPEARYQSMKEVSAALTALRSGSNGAGGGQLVRAVTSLPDTAPAAGGDDWLSFLAPSASNAAAKDAKAPVPGPAAKADQRQKQKGRFGGFAAALAGVWAKCAWFNTTKRKVAGAAAGTALLAAVTGVAALPFLLSSPNPPLQTAQNSKTQDKPPLVEPDVGVPPDKSAETKPDAAQGPAEKNAPQGKSGIPEKPKQPVDNSQKNGPQKSVPSKSPVPDKPGPKLEVPSATNTAPKTAVKTEVKIEVKPPVAEKPPLPAATPTVAAKPVSLDGLAAAVDLPSLSKGAKDAVSLGKLDLDPKLPLDLQLLGGDTIARSLLLGNIKFELQKEGDGASPGWSIQMAGKNKDAVKIARVWPEGGEWKIQWTDEARDKATLLRYCGLQFSCEKKTHFVALITPKIVPPLMMDVAQFKLDKAGKAAVREHYSRDLPLPDPSTLRLQILPLDKSLPKHDTKILEAKGHAARPTRGKPAEPVAGNKAPVKGHVILMITKEKTPRLAFDISIDGRGKDVQLDMLASCEISSRELAFELSTLQKFNAIIALNEANQSGSRKPAADQVQMTKMAKEQLKALEELVTELNQNGSIPFRIYVVLGETDDESAPKTVIFQSGQAGDAKPSGPKKIPKGSKKKGGAASDLEELKL